MIVSSETVRHRIAPSTPTSAVANHGVRKRETEDIHALTGPGHARSRPDEDRTRPNWMTIATTALRIATVMASETILLTVLLDVASRKALSGEPPETSAFVTWSRFGAPSRTAVVGISSAATVITSDHRIARAMPALDPASPPRGSPAPRSRCTRRPPPR